MTDSNDSKIDDLSYPIGNLPPVLTEEHLVRFGDTLTGKFLKNHSEAFKKVRIYGTPLNPLFHLSDIGEFLGLSDPRRQVTREFDENYEYVKHLVKGSKKANATNLLTEAGLRRVAYNKRETKGTSADFCRSLRRMVDMVFHLLKHEGKVELDDAIQRTGRLINTLEGNLRIHEETVFTQHTEIIESRNCLNTLKYQREHKDDAYFQDVNIKLREKEFPHSVEVYQIQTSTINRWLKSSRKKKSKKKVPKKDVFDSDTDSDIDDNMSVISTRSTKSEFKDYGLSKELLAKLAHSDEEAEYLSDSDYGDEAFSEKSLGYYAIQSFGKSAVSLSQKDEENLDLWTSKESTGSNKAKRKPTLDFVLVGTIQVRNKAHHSQVLNNIGAIRTTKSKIKIYHTKFSVISQSADMTYLESVNVEIPIDDNKKYDKQHLHKIKMVGDSERLTKDVQDKMMTEDERLKKLRERRMAQVKRRRKPILGSNAIPISVQ